MKLVSSTELTYSISSVNCCGQIRLELTPQKEKLQKSDTKHNEMIANISDVIAIIGAD